LTGDVGRDRGDAGRALLFSPKPADADTATATQFIGAALSTTLAELAVVKAGYRYRI